MADLTNSTGSANSNNVFGVNVPTNNFGVNVPTNNFGVNTTTNNAQNSSNLQFVVNNNTVPFSINSNTLPYTNIAGSSFQPYVAKQIESRKNLIKKSNRESSDLQWLTNKNVWIKISSGADVNLDNEFFIEKGDKLAKKYILQAGLMDHSGGPTSYELRYGLGENKAYGLGGTEDFGYVPMPGLTNISVKTGGKLGTLKEITFDFVCYNKKQLDIMSALYMRLGFGVLVEWGHTSFIDNSTDTVKYNPIPLDFFGIHTKEQLMENIQQKRIEHSGNYDASWGTVKNFSYSLAGNGTFNCQVQLVGAGDILESLKINQSGGNTTSTSATSEASSENLLKESPYPVISDFNLSFMNRVLYEIFFIKYKPSEITDYKIIWSKEYIELLQKCYSANLGINFGYNNTNNSYKFSTNSVEAAKGYNFSILNKSNNNINIPDIEATKVFSKFLVEYDINDQGLDEYFTKITDTGLNQTYITLAHLCYMIMATGIIYDVVNSKKSPHVYIDCNPETNRSYTFKGHCSLDPTVCLIGSEILPFGIKSKLFNYIKTSFPYFDVNAPEAGRFMYTLVNVNFIASTLRKYQSGNIKGDVYLAYFLKDILDGISKACGSYNEFRIVPDEDTNCVRILDNRSISNIKNYIDNPVTDYTEIPILGTQSIVYDFSYTSKIAPNTAAMITIAAQAQPYSLNSEEALAFSHLNNGLTNRLATTRVDATQETTPTPQVIENNDQRYIELRDLIEGIYGGTQGALTQQEVQDQQQSYSTSSPTTVAGVVAL